MGKKEKRNYEDMDCLEVNLNVKAVIVYQGFLTQSHFCKLKKSSFGRFCVCFKNLNFRKTALLAGICSVFSLGYAPQLFAVSSTDTVEAVQQTKKITGVVSDAMGPIIGANVLEKGTTNGVITGH